MNELLKSVLIILTSVSISIHWFDYRTEKIKSVGKKDSVPAKKEVSLQIVTLTNYVTVTNLVTVTNSIDVPTNRLISPGIPLPHDTQTVTSVDIKSPIENETRLRQIAKELTELLDGVKVKE